MNDLPARPARATRGALLALACSLPPVAAAGGSGTAATWQAFLERPISPGSVALLVEHAAEPAVLARWAEALRDPRSEVRAATARVVNVTASRSLLPDLLKALAAEADGEAAVEEIAAVAAVGGPPRDADLLELARKQPRFAADVAAALGRARGRTALDHLPSLRGLSLTPAQLGRFFELATAGDAEGLEPAASAALRERDAAAWAAVLYTARSQHVPLSDGVLISSLGNSSPSVRAATYWHLQFAPRGQASPELRQALDASPEATASPTAPRDDVGPGFAFELLQRMYRRPAREDGAWIASVREGGPVAVDAAVLNDKDVLRRFTPSELKALSARLAGDPNALDTRLKEEPPDRGADRGPAPRREPSFLPILRAVPMRTLDHFPRGFVSDVLGVSGCRAGENQFGGGRVTYARDGRPREVAFLEETPGSCADAVRALLLSSLVTSHRLPRPDKPELVIVPLSREPDGCPEARAGAPTNPSLPNGPAFRVGGRISEPKKIRSVPPVYPNSAKQDGTQGVVVLQATIADSGCVETVEVVQSVDPRLDVAALVAVSRWRYTPTLLDGRPVPVIMHVTVNFRLS